MRCGYKILFLVLLFSLLTSCASCKKRSKSNSALMPSVDSTSQGSRGDGRVVVLEVIDIDQELPAAILNNDISFIRGVLSNLYSPYYVLGNGKSISQTLRETGDKRFIDIADEFEEKYRSMVK